MKRAEIVLLICITHLEACFMLSCGCVIKRITRHVLHCCCGGLSRQYRCLVFLHASSNWSCGCVIKRIIRHGLHYWFDCQHTGLDFLNVGMSLTKADQIMICTVFMGAWLLICFGWTLHCWHWTMGANMWMPVSWWNDMRASFWLLHTEWWWYGHWSCLLTFCHWACWLDDLIEITGPCWEKLEYVILDIDDSESLTWEHVAWAIVLLMRLAGYVILDADDSESLSWWYVAWSIVLSMWLGVHGLFALMNQSKHWSQSPTYVFAELCGACVFSWWSDT